jgi:hypothetical protein
MTKLVTDHFKKLNVDAFIESLTEPANTAYYLFVGKHLQHAGGDTNVPAPDNSVDSLENQVYSNMVAGKRIAAEDVKYMISRKNWTYGTIYAEYKDKDSTLPNSDYYVNVDEDSFQHVYKCLYNNFDSQSIDEPRFNDTNPEDQYYSTSDGYVWKYMYSIDKATFNKFATKDFIPVIPNANVTANAVAGSIDVIHVEDGGQRYDNFYYGRFNADDIRIGGDSRLYNIGKTASAVNGFYIDCILTITEGTGKGQHRQIVDYKAVNTSKQITVNSQFTVALDVTSVYEVTPFINIAGNGTQSVNCVARAIVNSASSNSIHSIEILQRGAGYLSATANVAASANVGVTNTATLSVVIPPYGGHGYDVAAELGAKAIGISVSLANSLSGTISVENDYRTYGIIQQPLFANVNVKVYNQAGTVGTDGTFVDNEGIIQFKPIVLSGTVSINSTSNTIVGTNTDFENALEPNEYIVLNTGSTNFISKVTSIANSTVLTMADTGGFNSLSATASKIKSIATANISNITAGELNLTNVDGELTKGIKFIGLTSMATAFVNTNSDGIKINNLVKTFDTFTQLHRMEYSTITNAFIEDELVYQPQAEKDPTAYYHSSNDTFIFITNKFGVFNNGNTLIGNTSTAEASIVAQWPGDLVPNSGRVIYIENTEPITRSSTQTETFKIIVEY